MKKLFTLAMLLVFGASMHADDAVAPTNARIDVNGSGIALKAISAPQGGSFQNITWGKDEDRKFSLTGETAPFVDDQWVKSTFTFVAESDGKVSVNLLGNWTPNAPGKKNMELSRCPFPRPRATGLLQTWIPMTGKRSLFQANGRTSA